MANIPPLTAADIEGAWAILPTPAKPNASDWRETETVDLDETARITEGLIQAGINGIMSLGTYGEASTLTWAEKKAFIACVVDTVAGRVPFFSGSTTLNTRDTVAETRAALDIGAVGTMLGLPMWCAPSEDVAVRFFADVAEACPEIAICAYANPEAFKFEFGRSFWRRLSEIPQVVSAKYTSTGMILTDMALTQRRIKFMPVDEAYYGCARQAPEFLNAFWTSGALCGPSVSIRLRDMVAEAARTGDWSAVQPLAMRIGATYGPLFPNGSFKEFSTYNIGLEKARMNAAGWAKVGPVRPPYHIIPEPYVANAELSGRLWAKLAEEFEAADRASAAVVNG
ncbi:dihydrodipicolinate synthase family protein [Sphingomonas sp. SRS2]|uniref:dihydrodipicolinate synthase family protein n=1 Tax=Sphingomonas sp. SRS2 TaxID=133190 RepID=UPI00061848C5|nr:dihydrodipicolinate synthase family protein [Sphingomonas sp. SRS2]KKC26031.1 aldolase [Sphingomonas sp. SRS2]